MIYRQATVIQFDELTQSVAARRVNMIEQDGDEKEFQYVAFGTLLGMLARDGDADAKREAAQLLKCLVDGYQLAFAAGYAAAYYLTGDLNAD